jgi:hypothetical protein
MPQIPKGRRVVVAAGLYQGRRGTTLSEGNASQKIRVKLDPDGRTCKNVITWIRGYLLDPAEWVDNPSPSPPEIITIIEVD